MRTMLALLFLASCADPPADLLQPCSLSALPPQPPASGHRTINAVAVWANQLQVSREAADRVLLECSDRHAALADWVSQRRFINVR